MTRSLQRYFKQMRDQAHLLMCEPTHYQIAQPHPEYGHPNDMVAASYEAFTRNPVHFQAIADSQWQRFYRKLQQLGIKATLLEPDPRLFDQVFTADASLSLADDEKSFVLLSQFSHWARQGEVKPHLAAIQKIYPTRPYVQGVFASEGTGDNIYDVFRDAFFSGFSAQLAGGSISAGRSDKRAHRSLACVSGRQVISLEVQRPFFHIDTTLMPLSQGHILVYPGGLKQQSYQKLLQAAFADFNLSIDRYLILVSEEEALQYACNLINIGDLVLMPKTGDRLPNLLTNLGYQVEVVDVSGFIAAGGGPHCLTNNIAVKRVPGGLICA